MTVREILIIEEVRAAIRDYFDGVMDRVGGDAVPPEIIAGLETRVDETLGNLDLDGIVGKKVRDCLSASLPAVMKRAPAGMYELLETKTVSGSAEGSRTRCFRPGPVVRDTKPKAIAKAIESAMFTGAALGADAVVFGRKKDFNYSTKPGWCDTLYATVEAHLTVAFYRRRMQPAPGTS